MNATRIASRYWPLAALLVALVAVAVAFPSVEPRSGSFGRRSQTALRAPGVSTATDTVRSSTVGADTTAAGEVGAGNPIPAVDRGSARLAITPPSSVGVARSGVRCGPGVRQVPWSVYSPACLAAYRGYNGGATTHGVTDDTIVLSYRRSNSTQDAALSAALGDAAPGTDDQTIADLRTYISLFNRSYELYGRHVVLKDFQGQGDYLAELDGQDQPQAEADAASARGLGAFADVTAYKGSPFYWPALARQQVITWCCFGYPDSSMQQYSPYWYGLWIPTDTTSASLLAPMLCRRMAGLPASFAGDQTMHARPRVFGLIGAESPEWSEGNREIQAAAAGCGVRFAKVVEYSLNIAEFQSEATSAVAQMRAAGVTTVVCWCDPVIPEFISQAADQQQYYPEWFEPDWMEPTARLAARDQWSHAMSFAHEWTPPRSREAYTAFKAASGGAEPREQYFDYLYQVLLQVFGGIQAAGPNLNPWTFQQGLRSIPTSPPGEFGTWAFALTKFAPYHDSQISWWDPSATSEFDGKLGAWQACEAGARFPYDDPAALGPPRNQLRCFGH